VGGWGGRIKEVCREECLMPASSYGQEEGENRLTMGARRKFSSEKKERRHGSI